MARYTTIHIFPDGREVRVSIPSVTIRQAANVAARSLHDNNRASKAEAQRFGMQLSKTPVGETLTHEPSGYAARIELAES